MHHVCGHSDGELYFQEGGVLELFSPSRRGRDIRQRG